jgi:hypothetical protein
MFQENAIGVEKAAIDNFAPRRFVILNEVGDSHADVVLLFIVVGIASNEVALQALREPLILSISHDHLLTTNS